ncbi:MAG TPA: hypothetical protein VGL06_08885 [Pseudonocardiaceae bacterium]
MSRNLDTNSLRGKSYVVFFGEDDHDRNAIKILLFELIKEPTRFRPKVLRKPLSLVKGVERAKQLDRVAKVRAVVRALNAVVPVYATVFHQDADDCEPAHMAIEEAIKSLYSSLPGAIIAAVPAWELESWWFLFPSAVGSLHKAWRDPDQYVGKDVGKIRDSKEKLMACVRPNSLRRGIRFADYAEADSERIAQRIVELGIARTPAGKSQSWESFVRQVESLQ